MKICWKDRQPLDNLFYIVPLLMYAFVWDAIFHFARVQSLDGLSEFNGTGPGDTLLTISDQDSRRVSYLQLFKWNSDFFEQFCILFSYASMPRQEATTLGPPKKLDSLS